MNLWVDDCKEAPEGYAWAKTYDEALSMLRKFSYDALYLDFDLGGDRNGLDLLRAMKIEKRLPPKIYCISWNPVGRKQIQLEIESIQT